MIYANINYFGYINENEHKKSIFKQVEQNKLFKMQIPFVLNKNSQTLKLESFNIPILNFSIVEFINSYAKPKKYSKIKIFSLLGSEKKWKNVAKVPKFEEFWNDFLIPPEFENRKIKDCKYEKIGFESEKIMRKKQFCIDFPLKVEAVITDFGFQSFFFIEEPVVNQRKRFNFCEELIELEIKQENTEKTDKKKLYSLFLIENTNFITIKDIRLKRKTPESISPVINQNTNTEKLHKITIIESLEDLKNFKPLDEEKSKKSVSFAKNIENSIYYSKEGQKDLIPLKIFINKKSSITKSLLTSFSVDGYNVIGLELNETSMDGMDLILNWQTGVKICESPVLSSENSAFMFLLSLKDQLLKFDLILLIFFKSKSSDPGVETIEKCKNALNQSGIKLRCLFYDEIDSTQEIISNYLQKFVSCIDKDL